LKEIENALIMIPNGGNMKKRFLKFDNEKLPFMTIASGFLFYTFVGLLLILLPFSQKTDISFVDNLFNVVSAMSTTGLTTGPISQLYTPFGKLVLLALIQLGGIGYMTLTSFLLLSRNDKISTKRVKILSAEFPLPEGFRIKQFIKNIIFYTLAVELVGTICLWWQFAKLGIEKPLWSALFHTINAFCTAGFSIYSDSLTRFSGNIAINIIIIVLMYLGAIGFIVSLDFYRKFRGEVKDITFTSKIIIIMTAFICIAGTAVYSIGNHCTLLQALFQVASASTTTGFNTADLSLLSNASAFIIILAMIIGGSPAGTGGGIKTTTISALIGVIGSVLRGHPEKITFMNHEIPCNRVMTATATAVLYVFVLAFSIIILSLFDKHSFMLSCFEVTSALGCTGLSMGITAELSTMSKIILIITMYIGRVGPMTLGLAFFKSEKSKRQMNPKTDIAL